MAFLTGEYGNLMHGVQLRYGLGVRGGTYGWQAARKGFVFLGWTNTCANMPAWGAKDPRSIPENENVEIRYPGQKAVQIRKENQEIGIPVNRKIWDKIMSL